MDEFLSDRRVLVVEDEIMVLMVIESALADMGCRSVSVASSVADTLGLIETKRFDVAILDVNLGATPSFAIADALARQDVPFMFSTGYSKLGIDARFGDRPVLQKPYSDKALGAALISLLNVEAAVSA
ncbi:response regulator [Sphingopyxis sp.]|uniref:response regulator n=1 Tax=Sphingopyxis sp. TaxID=1908224 RepID=UPI0025D3DFC1|nr:response regulator [Sphingopyxis sp.]